MNTLQNGSSGGEVMMLQRALSLLGYNCTVDGQFGPGTQTAVEQFQTAEGLTANGMQALIPGINWIAWHRRAWIFITGIQLAGTACRRISSSFIAKPARVQLIKTQCSVIMLVRQRITGSLLALTTSL